MAGEPPPRRPGAGPVDTREMEWEMRMETINWPTGDGCNVSCPVCDRRVFGQAGLSAHTKAKHPDHFGALASFAKKAERDRKMSEIAAKQEKHNRANRKITITGAFADRIIGEMQSLIGMMEPYWSQGSSVTGEADDIIRILEAVARGENEKSPAAVEEDDEADYYEIDPVSGYSRADEEWFFDMDGKA